MTVYDAFGEEVSTQHSALSTQHSAPAKRDLRPGPGYVLVIRPEPKEEPETYLPGGVIQKAVVVQEDEARWSRQAIIARVGDAARYGETTVEPWFKDGDEVIISPSLFDRVELAPGAVVWLGPFSAVRARFEVSGE